MPIYGVEQPEILQVDNDIRLRKYDGSYDFAFEWYQDEETVYLVDGVRKPYSWETLKCMYEYLNKQGELYFIEVSENGEYRPIGDVCFWKDDMPIVIGEKDYRGKGIAKKVISCLIERGRALGYDSLRVNEIYDYNIASRKCFETLGFSAYEKTDKGNRFIRSIGMKQGEAGGGKELLLRRYMTSDCVQLAELFYETVHTVNARDYTTNQLDAWANGNVDLDKWDKSFIAHYTIVCVKDNCIVGFGDIDKTGYLDRLYVHKDYQRQGIASAICDELEKTVDTGKLITHASITARPFFEQRGYRVVKEQQVSRNGISLTNYVMEKWREYE